MNNKKLRAVLLASVTGMSLLAGSMALAIAGNGKAMVIVVPEGATPAAGVPAQVEHWRKSLGVDNVVWVDSVKREKRSGFASMAVLNFDAVPALQAWRQTSTVLPAPLQATVADVLAKAGTMPAPGSQPIYKISYYTLESTREAFQDWVDGYLVKYLDAQLENDILTRYAMYLEQGEGGRALLVLEYTDAEAEQGAEPIKAKLSEDIASKDAEYVRQLGLKETLRTTQSWTVAVPAR